MRRLLLAFICAILVLAAPTTSGAKSSLLEAVRPLQITFQGKVRNICTVSQINKTYGYWLTAAHCVDDPRLEYRIMDEVVVVMVVDVAHDLAILSTPTVRAGATLKLATKAPVFNSDEQEQVRVAGYPLGYETPFLTHGFLTNPALTLDGQVFAIFQLVGAPGNSGSPIVNNKDEVVSVLQIGWGQGFAPMVGGAQWGDFWMYTPWFDRK
jgi:S1-C subfamily serine protease